MKCSRGFIRLRKRRWPTSATATCRIRHQRGTLWVRLDQIVLVAERTS